MLAISSVSFGYDHNLFLLVSPPTTTTTMEPTTTLMPGKNYDCMIDMMILTLLKALMFTEFQKTDILQFSCKLQSTSMDK